jgi:hypothetical protein
VLFSAMAAGHRFRLWRVDADRVKMEREIPALFGPGITVGEIAAMPADARHASADARARLDDLMGRLAALAERCRRNSLSVLVPMGEEMSYRYQETLIHDLLQALRLYRDRLPRSRAQRRDRIVARSLDYPPRFALRNERLGAARRAHGRRPRRFVAVIGATARPGAATPRRPPQRCGRAPDPARSRGMRNPEWCGATQTGSSIDLPYSHDPKPRFDRWQGSPYLPMTQRTMHQGTARTRATGDHMEVHHRFDAPDHRPPDVGGLLALGLWLRAAFAGAAVAVAGVASLFDASDQLPLLTAITWIAAGGTFAWLSWQRALARLERPDADGPAANEHDSTLGDRPIARAQASS